MAEIAVLYKIFPEPEKRENVVEKLRKMGAKDLKEEEIGFGIVAIKALFLTDEERGTKEIEEMLQNLEGIRSFEVESATRL